MPCRATPLLALAPMVLIACGDGPTAKPPPILSAKGDSARTDDGRTVTLLAVGRTPDFLRLESSPVAQRQIWAPDGGPIRDWSAMPHVVLPTGIPTGDDVRAIAFAVSGSGVEEDAIGYVPDRAPTQANSQILEGMGLYPAPVDGKPFALFAQGTAPESSHYRLGLTSGDWRTLASRRIDLTRCVDETVLEGPWGRVHHVMPPSGPLSAETKNDLYGKTWGYYLAEPGSLPPAYELRVRLIDGSSEGPFAYPKENGRPTLNPNAPAPFATVEVKARRWQWIEFSKVHYRPRGVP